jgi:MarR family transcriptional regulator, negative regulator of the multidrug operon emrRAB
MPQATRNSNLLGAFVIAVYDQMLERIEADLGLSGQSAAALVVVGFNQGRSVDFLSGALQLSHSGCVRLVDKLVDADLLERRRGKDRRVAELHLTDAGERRMQMVLGTRRKYFGRVLQSLNINKQRQFTAMIETMLHDLTTCDEHAEAICRLCDEKVCPQGRCPVTLAVVKCASASALAAVNDLGQNPGAALNLSLPSAN